LGAEFIEEGGDIVVGVEVEGVEEFDGEADGATHGETVTGQTKLGWL
jgi:hypothetical protein